MNRRQFLAGSSTTLLGSLARGAASRPNILFVMPDQLRGMDLGCAGNTQLATPHIDRLARDGIRFTGAVSNTPICTPARGTLLTGKYAHETGTAANDLPLPSDIPTLPRALADQGYFTGFVGKWHLAGGKRFPGFVPPGPKRAGFQYWAANICNHSYLHQDYFRDDPTPIQMKGYDAITWTDLGIEFLDKAKAKDSPYCLYLQYPSPHDPYIAPPGFEKMYDPEKIQLRPNFSESKVKVTREDIANYYAAVTCLDQQIGRLLERAGENTIVLFSSDHGNMLGSHGTFLKRKPWEESMRVPGIFRLPGGARAGKTSDAPFSHIDVVPTFLGLTGSSPLPGARGFDYSQHLRTGAGGTPEFAHLAIYTDTAVDGIHPWRGICNRKWKYTRLQDRPWLLHDLEHDPYEMKNLVNDAGQLNRIAEFDARIARTMRDTGDHWQTFLDGRFL